jgi:hypothetical protein
VSTPVQVRVQARVRVVLNRPRIVVGHRAVVRGHVRPGSAGQLVRLQRRTGHTWRTVERDTLHRRDHGRFRFQVEPKARRAHHYRVVAARHGGRVRTVAPARSRGVVLRVVLPQHRHRGHH